jgi:hypothetical protein
MGVYFPNSTGMRYPKCFLISILDRHNYITQSIAYVWQSSDLSEKHWKIEVPQKSKIFCKHCRKQPKKETEWNKNQNMESKKSDGKL